MAVSAGVFAANDATVEQLAAVLIAAGHSVIMRETVDDAGAARYLADWVADAEIELVVTIANPSTRAALSPLITRPLLGVGDMPDTDAGHCDATLVLLVPDPGELDEILPLLTLELGPRPATTAPAKVRIPPAKPDAPSAAKHPRPKIREPSPPKVKIEIPPSGPQAQPAKVPATPVPPSFHTKTPPPPPRFKTPPPVNVSIDDIEELAPDDSAASMTASVDDLDDVVELDESAAMSLPTGMSITHEDARKLIASNPRTGTPLGLPVTKPPPTPPRPTPPPTMFETTGTESSRIARIPTMPSSKKPLVVLAAVGAIAVLAFIGFKITRPPSRSSSPETAQARAVEGIDSPNDRRNNNPSRDSPSDDTPSGENPSGGDSNSATTTATTKPSTTTATATNPSTTPTSTTSTTKPTTVTTTTKPTTTTTKSATTTTTTEPSTPVATTEPGCDQATCVLDNFAKACCARYKPREAGAVPYELERSAIPGGMSRVKAAVIKCGEKSDAKGIVKLAITVGGDGRVKDISVSESPDAALGECVAAAARKATFPASQEGGAFSYPFQF